MITRICACFLVLVSIIKAQQNELDPDIASLIDEVLGTSSNQFPTNIDNTSPKPEEEHCTCVPYYQCGDNGTIITDGRGLLDIRIRECTETIDVCCKEPFAKEEIKKPIIRDVRKGCGQRHAEGLGLRIIGDVNNEAQYAEFPWVVAVMREASLDERFEEPLNIYQCGGALIHEKVVLTAGHCAYGKAAPELQIRAGEWDTQTDNEIYPHQNRNVSRVIIHPGYNGNNLHNDFALLILDEPVTLGENVDIVCLPHKKILNLHHECFASGWGKDKFGQKGVYQVILKKIDLPMVPRDQCISELRKTRLGSFFVLDESFVCAGGIEGKDTCKGDGGSPLVCPIPDKPGQYEAVGLVAWGIGCGNPIPAVYANVAYAREWIDENMSELGLSPQY